MLGIEWAPIAGAIVGLIVGLTGVGGGALLAPILLIGFGLDLSTVIATDLLFASITKLVATGVHNKNKLVDWQIAKRLWMGSIPATIFVVSLAHSGIIFENPWWITKLLGILIIVSAVSLIFGKKLQLLQRANRISNPSKFKKYQTPATITSGITIGALVSLTSIGAGALGAMVLRTLYPLRMTPKKLVATDTTHAIPISLLAGASFLFMGMTDLSLLTYLLAGSIPAVATSSALLTKMPIGAMKLGLSGVLFLCGLKLFID